MVEPTDLFARAARRLRSLPSRLALDARIAAKWADDCRSLPLTRQHRTLYHIIHRAYHRHFRCFPALFDCRSFNDKIQWLKLFDQDSEIIRCADKLALRDYVSARAGDGHLVPLYQTGDRFENIDFESLPQSFVLKTNHDSGTVLLVKDKSSLDRAAVGRHFNAALDRPYGWAAGEWGYSFIRPRLFAEAHLAPAAPRPPPDYKLHCVSGRVRFLQYIHDRGFGTKEQLLDVEGRDLGTTLYPAFERSTGFVMPEAWPRMVALAETLAAPFKYVRVDLYLDGEAIYVGEMTFWPMAGFYQGEGQERLGAYLDFDRESVKPPILSSLRRYRGRGTLARALR